MVVAVIGTVVLWFMAELVGFGLKTLTIHMGDLVEPGPLRSALRILTYLVLVGGVAGLLYLVTRAVPAG